ncbi:MAG: ParB/RepB/Spo0J family partition protein [Epsilonproteobacteria bacterium]|nr:ParB/RepB/Spo0J family partition protein [Campylobacterota bacterium]
MALGRGLEAILGDVEESYIKDISKNVDVIKEIEISKIVPNPYQPRKHFDDESLQELANSIQQQGLMQPILVVKDDDYILIAGERRLRACQMLGYDKIKALIVDFDLSRLREYAIVENLQREDLNVLDLATSLYELIQEHSYTHEEVANILSKSRSYITNILRVLKLSDYAKEKLAEDKITLGHAKSLVNLDEQTQKKIVDTIIGQKLSARDVEQLVKTYKQPQPKKQPQKKVLKNLSLDELVDEIQDKYDLNISKDNNSIVINVTSSNDLKKIQKIFKI